MPLFALVGVDSDGNEDGEEDGIRDRQPCRPHAIAQAGKRKDDDTEDKGYSQHTSGRRQLTSLLSGADGLGRAPCTAEVIDLLRDFDLHARELALHVSLVPRRILLAGAGSLIVVRVKQEDMSSRCA